MAIRLLTSVIMEYRMLQEILSFHPNAIILMTD